MSINKQLVQPADCHTWKHSPKKKQTLGSWLNSITCVALVCLCLCGMFVLGCAYRYGCQAKKNSYCCHGQTLSASLCLRLLSPVFSPNSDLFATVFYAPLPRQSPPRLLTFKTNTDNADEDVCKTKPLGKLKESSGQTVIIYLPDYHCARAVHGARRHSWAGLSSWEMVHDRLNSDLKDKWFQTSLARLYNPNSGSENRQDKERGRCRCWNSNESFKKKKRKEKARQTASHPFKSSFCPEEAVWVTSTLGCLSLPQRRSREWRKT